MISPAGALRWDHNAHYHDYLLRQLPRSVERALDVGCGGGDFARLLAARARAVDAVDVSPEMIARARTVPAQPSNITWIEGDVLVLDLPLGGYDAVTAIASLHHLPLDAALRRFAGLLRPGGLLAVLGLYRVAAAGDYVLAALAMVSNPAVGAWKAARGAGRLSDATMPVRNAASTLAEIRGAADRHLPGAVLRRHLFFRYSLVWRRP